MDCRRKSLERRQDEIDGCRGRLDPKMTEPCGVEVVLLAHDFVVPFRQLRDVELAR
jgi:hypothetical protein